MTLATVDKLSTALELTLCPDEPATDPGTPAAGEKAGMALPIWSKCLSLRLTLQREVLPFGPVGDEGQTGGIHGW